MKTISKKRWQRIFLFTGISLLLLLGGLHLWFASNAARYLESVVATQSKGALRLRVKGFSFNYFTGYMEVRNGRLTSLDTSSKAATYDIQLQKLSLHLQSFLPLLFQRKLLLDSAKIHRPQIAIYRWRKDPALERQLDQISLPSELGRLYQSLLDGLDAMELKHIAINKGNFVVHNRMKPGVPPVQITGVDFSLRYQGRNSLKRDVYVPGKQSVFLHIPAQAIDLPDGRHRLAFRKLELELFRQRLQLDSCTIASRQQPGRKTNFNIFFKQLLLVGVDFDALYRLNKVKADSVYCADPMFRLDLKPATAANRPDSAKSLDAKEVLQDLSGNFELAYVGVTGAGFDIRINAKKKRVLSNARRDDFSLRNLLVNPDSAQPISVGHFDMNVRQYELHNEDSSTVFRFDSVQFRNNRVILRRFTATTAMSRGATNERRYLIPYFELEGINWYALLLEEKLEAENIYLTNPDIFYREGRTNTSRKQQSLFEILQTADSQVKLGKVQIQNGNLHLLPGNGLELKLSNTDLVLQTGALLQARDEAAIRESVEQLDVATGTLKLGSTLVQLGGLHYDAQQNLKLVTLDIDNPGVKAKMRGVQLATLVLNKKEKSLHAAGLRWQQGEVHLWQLAGKNTSDKQDLSFLLRDIKGKNTTFNFEQKGTSARGTINNLQVASVAKPAGGKFSLAGIAIEGGPLEVRTGNIKAGMDRYQVEPGGSFAFQALSLEQSQSGDSLRLTVQKANGKTDLDALFHGVNHVQELRLEQPSLVLRRQIRDEAEATGVKPVSLQVDRLIMEQPQADIVVYQDEAARRIQMPAATNGRFILNNLQVNGQQLAIGKLDFKSGPLWVTMPDGTVLGTQKGNTRLAATNLQRSFQDGKPGWSGDIDSIGMDQPLPFSWGPKGSKIAFSAAMGGKFSLPGKQKLSEFLLKNPGAWLRTGTASYRDSSTIFYWETAHYDAARKTLSLDSISVQPAVSRIVKMATTPYQTDYTTFSSGPVTITGFDRNLFEKDSAFVASNIEVQRPVFTVYRDKRPPFRSGIIKPLPVNLVKKISIPVSIDRVQLQNGLVVYTELNGKTNEEGIISLTNLNAAVGNIRNYNLKPNDSLSLNINALLLDSAQMSLNFRESYLDTLAGFFVQLRMKPTSLSFLNPVVAPLSSVNIVSGTVDSLYLNAIGREHMALGEMHLFYRNLKIRFVQFGENNRSKLLLRAMSFLANSFIIKTNNNGRKSLLYLERSRDRSFFNYLVKMTFSGIASGVGVTNNKKVLRRYRRDLEQLRQPQFRNAAQLENLVKDKKAEK